MVPTKEIKDQGAHALVTIIALVPIALACNPFTGAWAGLCMGLVREYTEWQHKRQDGEDGGQPWTPGSLVDLATWTLFGALVGFLGTFL
jgi:hypothetical protein